MTPKLENTKKAFSTIRDHILAPGTRQIGHEVVMDSFRNNRRYNTR